MATGLCDGSAALIQRSGLPSGMLGRIPPPRGKALRMSWIQFTGIEKHTIAPTPYSTRATAIIQAHLKISPSSGLNDSFADKIASVPPQNVH